MQPEQTKQRILAAAAELFGELGFDATSTRDIAARSGVNKALLHYHFGSKDELLAALLDGYYGALTTTLAAAWRQRAHPAEQVQDVVDAYADFLAEHRAFCAIVHREVASGRHVEQIVARTLSVLELRIGWFGEGPTAELMQILTSVYGMVVTYFTYGPVLARLTGADPFAADALQARKRHVRRIVALLFADMAPDAKGT